jgi:hypothetical protein
MVPDGEKGGSVELNIKGLPPHSYFGGCGTGMLHWSRLRSLSQRAARDALSLFHQRVSPIFHLRPISIFLTSKIQINLSWRRAGRKTKDFLVELDVKRSDPSSWT